MPTRSTKRLTKTVVESLLARDTDYFAWDAEVPGFGVRVHTTGRRTFVLKYQLGGRHENGGRARRVTLGDYPTLTVDEARRRATIARAEALNGGDPQAAKLAKREAIRTANQAPTVEALVEAYVKDRRDAVAANQLRAITVDEYERLLTKSVVPVLGAKKAREVTRSDVQHLWRTLHAKPAAARRAVRVLAQAFTFAIDTEWGGITASPCARVLKRLEPRRPPSRKTSLEVPEYAALGAALSTALSTGLPADPRLAQKKRGISRKRRAAQTGRKRAPYKRVATPTLQPADPVQVAALRFAALSGWRRAEIFGLRWSELKLSDRTAVLPESKTGRSVRALGAAAVALLKSMESVTKSAESALVFSLSEKGAKRPEPRHLWRAVRHASGLELRLHDLRHSWVTMARRLGYHDGIIAAAVGHTGTDMTSRYGDIAHETVRAAVDDISQAIAAAMVGQTAEVLALMSPKPKLKLLG